jgi:hypothetical protein
MSKVYTLAQVVLAHGLIQIGGAGEGGFVELEKKNDDFTAEEMIDGEVILCFTGSRLWTAKITLAQTSNSNDVLSAIRLAGVNAARNGNGGASIVPTTVSDTGGSTLFNSPRSIVGKPAKADFQSKVKDREWTILCTDVDVFIGGQL